MNDIELVTQFLKTMAAHDTDATVAFMSEDVFVHNMPVTPTHSREEYRQRMLAYDLSGGFAIKVLNIAGDGNGTVLTERVDSFGNKNGRWIHIPIMGAFTVKDGLIVSWREYFDLETARGVGELMAERPDGWADTTADDPAA